MIATARVRLFLANTKGRSITVPSAKMISGRNRLESSVKAWPSVVKGWIALLLVLETSQRTFPVVELVPL